MATNNALNNNLTNCSNLPVPGGLSATGTPSATTFLRGDGTWNVPASTPGGSTTQLQYNNAGAFGGDSGSTTNGAGALTIASLNFSNFATGGVKGTTTNNDAATGYVGEFITSAITTAAGISNNTATNLTSISLPSAGDYDVWGSICFETASTTVLNQVLGWISSTSASLPTDNSTISRISWGSTGISNIGSGVNCGMAVGARRFSVAGATTVYISGFTTFTTSTNAITGFIIARRRR